MNRREQLGGARMRASLRRGSEEAEARFVRGIGEPALFAMGLSAVGSSVYFALGVVADRALGLTPIAFLFAGIFFVVTMLTYVEGNSLHPEWGGASMLARYAFDELWSFIAGWAILLDYLIVMAVGAFAVSHYLAAFWGPLDDPGLEIAIAGATIAYVAWANIQGLTGERFKFLLRLSLVSVAVFVAIVIIGLAQLFDLSLITEAVELGETPQWDDVIFAGVIAAVALTGIEAASGLAGEIRVSRTALRRLIVISAVGILALFLGISTVALMAVPVEQGTTELGGSLIEAPVLGVVSEFEPGWVGDTFSYVVGAVGAVVLVQAVNGQMLGIGRVVYSLGTNRQVPSVVSRLDVLRSTPYVAILIAAAIAFGLSLSRDVEFLAGIFAFGAMLAFTLAHIALIALRFREPDGGRVFRVPFCIRLRGSSVPLSAVVGAVLGATAWVSVVLLHEGARVVGGAWMLFGIALYVVHRRNHGMSLTQRFSIPAEHLKEAKDVEYGSILVPVFGSPLDDDIVGTAGRLAAEEAEEGEGGAVLEALYVFEIPLSLPLDARVPPERLERGRHALARAKEVGEEYEGVEVATAMVRGRTAGAAIVAEAKRRGVEAIVLAAEEPSRIRGGGILGGRTLGRDRFAGEMTRYVIEKAPCKVILTAPPAEVAEQAAEKVGDGAG